MGYEFWPTIKYILDYFLKKKKKKKTKNIVFVPKFYSKLSFIL